jgi:hydrogenase maturation protease
MSVAPLLVVGIGNPSRGDDALGPLFVERAEVAMRPEVDAGKVEFITDFQLQPEHALDLKGRRRVVFVDASVKAAAPFTLERVQAARDASFSTHALSPAAVLDAFVRLYGDPPESWVLAIHGDHFELGEPLSASAFANLEAALLFFLDEPRTGSQELHDMGRKNTSSESQGQNAHH